MKTVVLISAIAEWNAVKEMFPQLEIENSAYGESARLNLAGYDLKLYHSGWGKIASAGMMQYVTDHDQPDLVVNLGTCGGFEGLVEQGDARACTALDQMAQHLGRGIAMLVTGLAPDVVVVVGEVTRVWSRVGPIVQAAVRSWSFTGAAPRIVATNSDALPRLRGTFALVLQKHFGAPFIA